ncbi:MAG TPA: hypothetical protein VLX29_07445 [Nitrospirota bacterium]|nr:hypothetical protein [Nitrospirota bacterium]
MENLKKSLRALFAIGVITLMAIGTVIVIAQIYSLIILDGKLAISISQKLAKPACLSATLTGVIGFLQGYVFKIKMGE